MQIFTKRINITADFDNFVMGNDISSGLSFLFQSICFDFLSTYIGSSVIGTHTFNGLNVITHMAMSYLSYLKPSSWPKIYNELGRYLILMLH